MDPKINQLMNYINTQIKAVSLLDETANKKGSALQTAKAHKKGYLEGLNNVRTLMVEQFK
jgi:hypothetical protein|tara:strand:+ start:2681 stop:2860 length:180 start_codon:yes stop_codon:yes gene_type:complete